MRKLFSSSVNSRIVLSFCALTAPLAVAQDDLVSGGLSVQQIWDSNYARTQNEDSEQITLSAASLSLNKTLSRQRLLARWQGQRYDHAERTDLDATLHDGRVAWVGQWGSRFKTNIEWLRDSYPVDRLEFPDKDIVKRDDVVAEMGYGTGHKLMLGLGARQSSQTHTNDLREGLDFDEDEAFFETGYKTGIRSTLTARVRVGERTHPNEPLFIPSDEPAITAEDLDFDYQQVELQGTWVASPKTSITTTLGYFNRDGIVNDGTGTVVTLDANWELTPKVQLTAGYTLKQPAVGETSDSPSDTHVVSFDATWQWTSKISLSSGARYSEQEYDGSSPGPTREEKLYYVTPLVVSYSPTESFSIKLASSWTDRQSPLLYRDYTSAEGTLGLFFRY